MRLNPGVSRAVEMPPVMSTLGFLLFIVAIPFIVAEGKVCHRIEEKVRGEVDALTPSDIWLSHGEGRKLRKLSRMAESSPDQSIRNDAREALRLGRIVFVLIASGLVLHMVGMYTRYSQHAG